MPMFEDMSPAEKAAALMIAVGPEIAAEICTHLDEDTVINISREMARIEKLTPQDKEELLGEFILELQKLKHTAQGGEEFAKKILVDAFGVGKAREIYKKVEVTRVDDAFAFLDQADPEVVVRLISKEHPQAVAVMMAYMNPTKAGMVMKYLPRDVARDVAFRIARMENVAPEFVHELARALRKKYDEMNSDSGLASPGGVDRLAEIMNYLDGDSEHSILQHFEKEMPDKAREIRDRIYSFENIVALLNREVRVIIDELNDDRMLALALKGAGDEIRFKVLRNVSNNRASDILAEMERMGPVRMTEILDARQKIVYIMRRLNDVGSIVIRKGDEQYVE